MIDRAGGISIEFSSLSQGQRPSLANPAVAGTTEVVPCYKAQEGLNANTEG
jgi:hypothetical protein